MVSNRKWEMKMPDEIPIYSTTRINCTLLIFYRLPLFQDFSQFMEFVNFRFVQLMAELGLQHFNPELETSALLNIIWMMSPDQ